MRDIVTRPYTADEQRVVDYIIEASRNQIGGGDDPIGFILASHRMLRRHLAEHPIPPYAPFTELGVANRVIDQLRTALRVNALRHDPTLSHEEITKQIQTIIDAVTLASDPNGIKRGR